MPSSNLPAICTPVQENLHIRKAVTARRENGIERNFTVPSRVLGGRVEECLSHKVISKTIRRLTIKGSDVVPGPVNAPMAQWIHTVSGSFSRRALQI